MADIDTLLKEKRTFKPAAEFTKQANWNKKTTNEYRKLGESNPTRFWAQMAKENVSWFTPWKKVLDWKRYAYLLSHGEQGAQRGGWMIEGLRFRDRWESQLLRTTAWSPRQ